VSVDSSAEGTDALSSNASDTNGCGRHDEEQTQEQMIAKALEECLGLAGDDPDIAEAKRRLLASKILSPEMFECEEDEYIDNAMGRFLGHVSESGDESAADSDEEEDKKEEVDEELGGYKDTDYDDETPYDPHRGINSDRSFHEAEDVMPTESTGLLSPAQKLRPSIFTTIASLAEIEGESEKNEKGEGSDAKEKSP
jgi:hypothetical protein